MTYINPAIKTFVTAVGQYEKIFSVNIGWWILHYDTDSSNISYWFVVLFAVAGCDGVVWFLREYFPVLSRHKVGVRAERRGERRLSRGVLYLSTSVILQWKCSSGGTQPARQVDLPEYAGVRQSHSSLQDTGVWSPEKYISETSQPSAPLTTVRVNSPSQSLRW